MPRIRTIKPEYWSDEKLAPLDALTRLVFLGLISHADDAGRMVDSVKMLDGALFPETDDTCGPALEKLAACGRIVRYVSGSGQRLIQITNWGRHQKVDHASKHVLPPPPREGAPDGRGPPGGESPRDSREALANVSRDPRASTLDHGPVPGTNDLGGGPNAHAREASGGGVEKSLDRVEELGAHGSPDPHPPESGKKFVVRKSDLQQGLDALWAAGIPQVALGDMRQPLRRLMEEHGPQLVLAAVPGLPLHPWVKRRGLFSVETLRVPGMLPECAQLASSPAQGGGGGGTAGDGWATVVEILPPGVDLGREVLRPELADQVRAWCKDNPVEAEELARSTPSNGSGSREMWGRFAAEALRRIRGTLPARASPG